MSEAPGHVEVGICLICNTVDVPLAREYYYYDVKCECCQPKDRHFEIVRYCAKCTPKPPQSIRVWMKAEPIKE